MSHTFVKYTLLSLFATSLGICQAVAEDATKVAAPAKAVAASEAVEAESVEFFKAMEEKQIEVKFIAKNPDEANIIIKNKTDKPLKLQIPEGFAGIPVLAQFGGQQGGGGGFGGGGQGGGSQGIGGGGGGQQGGFGGGGGGQFSIAPEKVRRVKVETVCLDHGKPDPSPKIEYKMVPLESYVTNPEVIETVKAFGRGEIAHEATQAAVWHMNNDVSWEELATKMKGPRDPRFGQRRPWFSRQTMESAVAIAAEAKKRVEAKSSESSTSERSLSEQPQ